MCEDDNDKNGKKDKGDEDMTMIKEKVTGKYNEKISRQELRKKLIRETVKENRIALKRLSRT